MRGIELFVTPTLPPSRSHYPARGQFLLKTPHPSRLKCTSLQTAEIKQDLKAMHFLPGNLIWIDCSGFSAKCEREG